MFSDLLFFLSIFLFLAQANSVTWKTLGNTYFFYNGDAIDPNVQAAIKTNFISLMTASYIPPFFCTLNSNCREDNIDVYAGALKGKTKV